MYDCGPGAVDALVVIDVEVTEQVRARAVVERLLVESEAGRASTFTLLLRRTGALPAQPVVSPRWERPNVAAIRRNGERPECQSVRMAVAA